MWVGRFVGPKIVLVFDFTIFHTVQLHKESSQLDRLHRIPALWSHKYRRLHRRKSMRVSTIRDDIVRSERFALFVVEEKGTKN